MRAGDNELARCSESSRFCAGAPSSLIYVLLYIDSEKASDTPLGTFVFPP